jgi:zinc D-Ala-D-Ala carboxypeptidase
VLRQADIILQTRLFLMILKASTLLFTLAVLAALPSMAAPDDALTDLTGDFKPETHTGFSKVPHALHLKDKKIYLRKDALEAFRQLEQAFANHIKTQKPPRAGYTLRIVSAFRSLKDQKNLWQSKQASIPAVAKDRKCDLGAEPHHASHSNRAEALCILELNSAPGTSRHHWGTDIDINSDKTDYWATARGRFIHDWLRSNAGRFGFCQVYDDKLVSGRKGYEREDWHWSYMPIARPMLAAHQDQVTDKFIANHLGMSVNDVADLKLREDYVAGISACPGVE